MKRGLLYLSLLFASTIAHAEKFIVGAQNIEYFPHYDFTSPIDKGLGWAILEAFSKKSGHEFLYLSMPTRRLQMEMLKGNVDFVYPDNPGWYNQITKTKDKYFSQPLTQAITGTLVKTENAGKGIDAIKRIAMPLGFTPVNWQSRIDNSLTQIIWVTSTYSGLSMLQLNRVDATDLEYHVAQHFSLRTQQLGQFTLDLTLPHNEIPFMLSSLRHKKVIDELNSFIQNNPDIIGEINMRYNIKSLEQLKQSFLKDQNLNKGQIWH